MSRRKLWTSFISTLASLACASAVAHAAPAKGIKKDDARKLIAAVSILELGKGAVVVKEISPPGATVTVLAGIKLAFRFARDAKGAWRVEHVRTGDRQWESFDLLARALGEPNVSLVRAELDAFAAELETLAHDKAAAKDESRGAGAEQKQPASRDGKGDEKEFKRGALSVKNPAAALSAMGSSAVVEIEIETSVDFVKDARGRWQVARVNIDGRPFAEFAAVELALDAAKRERARADLENLSAALEAYRRERGFYVVAESATVLVDHLNPRYTETFIRFDPWHRPYEYEGTRDRFTLRSLGADGKANTADDVTMKR
ncbi:MAG TPA: type II secretion system protein GspG [Pyrinomonadaceae bacterium]|nr:type II secretion system protein GspG [Pyrinomonadaceae bacterium]